MLMADSDSDAERSLAPSAKRLKDAREEGHVPRARELAAVEFQQLSEAQIRRDLGAEGVSEDELLLRYLLRKDDIERMRASPTGSGPVKEYDTEGDAMVSLISELSRLAGGNTVRISKPGFSLTLGKGALQA